MRTAALRLGATPMTLGRRARTCIGSQALASVGSSRDMCSRIELRKAPSSSSSPPIVVVGINVVDCKLEVPRLPSRGETVLSSGTSEDFGGKGANQAVQASLLLGPGMVSFVGRVGDDERGRATRAALEAAGTDCAHLAVDTSLPTGFAAVMVDPRGANAIVVAPGANAQISPSDVERAAETFAGARIVMCQLEASMDASLAAFALADNSGNGALKVLNAAPIPANAGDPRLAELCNACDVLCVNELEAAQLLGWDPTRVLADAGSSAAVTLLEVFPGPSCVILTLGEGGACFIERGSAEPPVGLAALPCVAKSTVGAGDSFLGAFAAALSRSTPMYDATVYANKVAGHSVQYPGTQSSYHEARAVLEKRGDLNHDAHAQR